jgi:hypothetical protein
VDASKEFGRLYEAITVRRSEHRALAGERQQMYVLQLFVGCAYGPTRCASPLKALSIIAAHAAVATQLQRPPGRRGNPSSRVALFCSSACE